MSTLCSERKRSFNVLERLEQVKCNILVFGGFCIVLVRDPVQLPPVLTERFLVKGLPSSTNYNINDNTI